MIFVVNERDAGYVPMAYDAILLIAFGGPSSPEEIRPFLARVTRGIPIAPQRLEEVAGHYEAVGGKSPLNEITFRQAAALRSALAAANIKLPVHVGFRNAEPFLVDALKQMSADGVHRALGFILSAHQSEASWDRYQQNIADARAELGNNGPQVDYCAGWHDHPLFIQTWVELIGAALDAIPPQRKNSTALMFTAHSLPIAMAARSPYAQQLQVTIHLIGDKSPDLGGSLAYQSRSGRPTDPWLEPDINTAIRTVAEGHTDLVVAPIGFVCDHVEILYDLDIEARKVAEDHGLRFHRVRCPNDHPTFIRMIADVIERKLKDGEDQE